MKILWALDYFFLSAIIVNKHNKEIKNANRAVIWSSANAFIFGAGGLKFFLGRTVKNFSGKYYKNPGSNLKVHSYHSKRSV